VPTVGERVSAEGEILVGIFSPTISSSGSSNANVVASEGPMNELPFSNPEEQGAEVAVGGMTAGGGKGVVGGSAGRLNRYSKSSMVRG